MTLFTTGHIWTTPILEKSLIIHNTINNIYGLILHLMQLKKFGFLELVQRVLFSRGRF